MPPIIILGTSRPDGDTARVVTNLAEQTGWEVVSLSDYRISNYDYEHENRNDNYLPLMRRIIRNHDTLIFATPVYWYAMSGTMKVFLDRLTDLLTIEKELGRRLRGKRMAVITSSGGDNLGEDFWLPFEKTAEYLGMEFLGGVHTTSDDRHPEKLNRLIERIG